MKDESQNKPQERSWLERLSHSLSRDPQDRDQLIELLRDAQQRNLLNAEALSMIEGVLQVSNLQVRDIMIPRTQTVMIDHDATPESFLPTMIQTAHSRFPVVGDNRDEILGVLHAKDLLQFSFNRQQDEFSLKEILRPAVFVPESKLLDELLKEFRLNHNHMAIVVDEYGGMSGVVTIEDVLEQIVGEIEDEFDIDDDAYIKKHSDSQYIIKALTPIEEFNDYFNANLANDEFDTIGGYVTKAFGYLPKPNETINLGKEYTVKVLHADNRRIRLLRFCLHMPISKTEE